ncbi:MAG TPA: hypothetical protein DCR01_04360 [Flavobacteriales bacterium]|nr:hypothetical protein [Flavobacteriales bacterium]|tara:strand:+ start:1609 stop:2058 length:450 start_codon:yes stop_codon:yes gene_type:complete
MKGLFAFCLTILSFVSLAQSSSDDILRRAEVMPVFQQCEDPNYADAPYPCTMKQLSDYIKAAVVLEETTGNITKCVISLVVEKDGSVSNVQLLRGVFVNAENEQEKLALENTLNTMITETVEGLNFVLPGYQNGEKSRVMLQLSASVNY